MSAVVVEKEIVFIGMSVIEDLVDLFPCYIGIRIISALQNHCIEMAFRFGGIFYLWEIDISVIIASVCNGDIFSILDGIVSPVFCTYGQMSF